MEDFLQEHWVEDPEARSVQQALQLYRKQQIRFF